MSIGKDFCGRVTAKPFAQDRVRRVTAYGDREPVVENRMNVRNNRIELIFLRQ